MLSRREQRLRRRARARVLQAVYAWDAAGRGLAADAAGRTPVTSLADRLWDDLALGGEERAFAGPLVRTIQDRAAEIDAALADVTANWRLERLGAIERAVLRMAAAELLRGEAPPRVVLQEAVRLAERYGAPEGARFVNGVLDALARRLGSV